MSNTRRRWCNLWSFIIILTIFTERLSLNHSLLVAIVSKAIERGGGHELKLGSQAYSSPILQFFYFSKTRIILIYCIHTTVISILMAVRKMKLLRNQFLFAEKYIIFEKNECLQNKNWRVSVMFFPCRFFRYIIRHFTLHQEWIQSNIT